MREEIELPNKEKIRTIGEKETYRYLGILQKFSRGKNRERCFLRTYTIIITICNSDDATQPHTWEIGNPNTGCEEIQSGHRDGIWHRKRYYATKGKRKTENDSKE